ncbi:ABC transporter ATP-binding protein [Myroides sp. LJL116]
MDPFSLTCQDVAIGYKKIKSANPNPIQDNINICIKSGELTSLLGVNGSGKSTLIKTLTGSLTKLKGNILINGIAIEKYDQKEISKLISIVLTESIVGEDLSVYELVKIGRTPHLSWKTTLQPIDKQCIDRAIEQTQITHLVDKSIYALSDGQMQRVLIARALAQDTPIIILDEPSNHLDFHHKVALYSLLQDLAKKQNKAILFSSHDMELALQFSDNAIVLKENFNTQNSICSLIEQNVFDDFFDHPAIAFDKEHKRFLVNL